MNGVSLSELVKRRQAMLPAFRTRSRSKFPRPQIPNIRTDIEEVRRLMKRIPTGEINDNTLCCICRSPDHMHFVCVCHEKIPEGVVLGPSYDSICLGCGKIGETCCNKGSRAVSKHCLGCRNTNHWFWERKCPQGSIKDPVPQLPSIDGQYSPVSPHDNYVEEVFEFSSGDENLEGEEGDEDEEEDELRYPKLIIFERIIQKDKEDRLARGERSSDSSEDESKSGTSHGRRKKSKKSKVQEWYSLPGSELKFQTKRALYSHIRKTYDPNSVISVKDLRI